MNKYDIQLETLNKQADRARVCLDQATETLNKALQANRLDEDLIEDCTQTAVLAYESCLHRQIDIHLYHRRARDGK